MAAGDKHIIRNHKINMGTVKAVKPWPNEETRRLYDLWMSGMSPDEIADALGRDKNAVLTQMYRMSIPHSSVRKLEKTDEKRATYKLRQCMCCDRNFLSEGAHNRLCRRCRTDDGTGGRDYNDIRLSDLENR